MERILDTGKPGVSDLFLGPISGQQIFTVGVPVKIDESIAYSLNATFTHQQFMELLRAHAFPVTWRVAITDGANRIVARSHEIDKFLGKPVSPGLLTRMQESDNGSLESVTLDGVPVLTAYSRSPISPVGALPWVIRRQS